MSRRVRAPGLCGRVVTGLVADRLAAGLVVVLLENEVDSVCHLRRQRPVRSLERQVGGDQEVWLAVSPIAYWSARGRRKRGRFFASTASAAPAATCGYESGERSGREPQ